MSSKTTKQELEESAMDNEFTRLLNDQIASLNYYEYYKSL